jgi:peptide-methionine (S)-S-oxide reductase
MPEIEQALPGRDDSIEPGDRHFINGNPIKGPWPPGFEIAVFGNGCYVGGFTPNPTYDEVCSGMTGHTEATLVVFDPNKVEYEQLLKIFWEHHDPTQGMGQGNDIGTQYRSGIYPTTPEQHKIAEASKARYQPVLTARDYDEITTEIKDIELDRDFFYAEEYHQQYLGKNPNGYRCHSATGIPYPVGATEAAASA